ncbi:hypothetical protein NP233_g5849 [Leucocoprinus birnbaumii]|uniref:Uncharacterized protein n=1 Tax=Leucocoprinus birnbaumii TaxID=56174 RepID=A0AAD5VUS4_9AGAR|nr:hypothetical protein NP233_g5849 [Leucocoprinus birnbaumii]
MPKTPGRPRKLTTPIPVRTPKGDGDTVKKTRRFVMAGKLVDLLELSNKPTVVEKLKSMIQNTIDSSFDFSLELKQHDPSLMADLKTGLCQRFPDIFEHIDLNQDQKRARLEKTMMYAKSYFYRMQQSREQQPPTPRKEGKPTHEPSPPNTRSDDSVFDLSTDSPSPPSKQSRSKPRKSLSPPVEVQPPNEARTAFLNPPGSNSPSKQGIKVKAEVAYVAIPPNSGDVAQFLENCAPGSMTFLLDSFMEFGCRNRAYLELVAKRDDAEIENFLKAVLLHHPPARLQGKLFEMDVLALKWHFKQYFSDQ